MIARTISCTASMLAIAAVCSCSDAVSNTSSPLALGDSGVSASVSSATVCLANGTVHDPNAFVASSGSAQHTPKAESSDWADDYWKWQCASTDWMSGISKSATKGYDYFQCQTSPYANSAGSLKGGSFTKKYPSTTFSAKNTASNWDTAATSWVECDTTSYASGFSENTSTGKFDLLRCGSFSGQVASSNCRGLTIDSGTKRESTSSGTWSRKTTDTMLECGDGSYLAGVSLDSNKEIRGILCCDGGPDFTPVEDSTCCNETTYNAALTKCLQNSSKYSSYCDLVDYCCTDGVSAYAGSTSCDQAAAASDPSTEGGTGITMGTSTATPSASASNGNWSFSFNKSSVRGNSNFGGGYEGSLAFTATNAHSAKGQAKLLGYGRLFGTKVNLATVDVAGTLTGAEKSVSCTITVLGIDVSCPIPTASGSTWSFDNSLSKTFVEVKQTYVLGVVPLTVSGSLTGTLGFKGDVSVDTATPYVALSSAGPYLNLSASASAAIGGSMPGFKLEAGVSGALTVFDATFANSVKVTPSTSNVMLAATSSLTLEELSGSIDLFLKAKILFYKKTWTYNIADWTGAKQTTQFLDYSTTTNF